MFSDNIRCILGSTTIPMTMSEHVTALFLGGWYYWFTGDEATADLCWRTGVEVINLGHYLVGEA